MNSWPGTFASSSASLGYVIVQTPHVMAGLKHGWLECGGSSRDDGLNATRAGWALHEHFAQPGSLRSCIRTTRRAGPSPSG
ncbi:hypothetical protein ACFPRL_24495 [Pseudoclavibacter helvolus]